MTTPSNAPIPSSKPQDLLFNAEKMDELVNAVAQFYVDRFGVQRLTAQGAVDSMRAYSMRGDWVSGLAYAAKDLIRSGGLWYLCLDAHTSGATFAGDQAAHWRLYEGLEIGCTVVAGNGVTDNSAALAAANLLGLPIAIKGTLHIASATTITVPIVNTMSTIFSATSNVTINNGLATRPEWFGGSLDRMYASWPAAGGIGLLADKVYGPMTTQMTKGALIGTRLPRRKSGNTGLERGSIVQGPLNFRGDGITLRGFGVDSGSDVCTALYGGAAKDGFLSGLPVPTRNVNLNMHDLIAICKDPTSAVHGFAIEGYSDASVSNLDATFGAHGIALKVSDSNVSKLRARLRKQRRCDQVGHRDHHV